MESMLSKREIALIAAALFVCAVVGERYARKDDAGRSFVTHEEAASVDPEKKGLSVDRQTVVPSLQHDESKRSVSDVAPMPAGASEAPAQKNLITKYKATWRAQLPDVEAVLGLHHEEFDQLLTLLAEFGRRQKELSDSSGGRDVFDRERALYAEREQALKIFFGEAKYQEWVDYLETTGVRAQVQSLANVVAGSTPLREDQRAGLLASLIETNRRYQSAKDEQPRREGRRLPPSQQARVKEYNRFSTIMHLAAAPYLNSAQLLEYDKILEEGRPWLDEEAPAL
jgi:hypothetical protein